MIRIGSIALQNPKAWAYVGGIAAVGGLAMGAGGALLLGLPALAIGGFLTGFGYPMIQRLPPPRKGP